MTARPRDIRRLAAAVLAAMSSAVLAVLPADPPSAAAAPGTWGAGGYPYLDGKICTSTRNGTEVTTPLTSWDLGAGRGPGFLTTALTSDGSVDSAAPPLPSVGTQQVSPVTAGTNGFGSAEVATYAALLARFGRGGAAQTARVADAVIRKVSGAAPGCVDTAAEAALLRQAAQLAGPYSLTFADQPHGLRPGAATPVSVELTSATGHPVPGASVTFTSRGARLSAITATTNAAGSAVVQARVPPGTHATDVAIAAHAALPTGLDEINAERSPTPTDPSGSVAKAIVAAPPTSVTARKNLTLNLSAHPVLRLSLPDRAVALGTTTDPRATITGMYGHKATVVFTIRGPEPISRHSFCADRTARDFGAATIAATSTLTITGDSVATAGRWQPSRRGCYLVTARVRTLNSMPERTVRARAPGAITVLDTRTTLETAHALVRTGEPVTGQAVLEHGYGLGGRLDVALRGPVQPPAGASTCAAAHFSSAPVAGTGTGQLDRDVRASATGFSIRAGAAGCYELAGAVLVRLPNGVTMRVPVADAAAPRLLAVDPSVSYAMSRTWSFARGQVSARVTVIGTFNQPVHVALRMRRIPNTDLDCRGANYSAATSAPAGPAVATRTNLATVSVRSAPLSEPGCYEPVPVLTMDANHAITATGSFDSLTSAVAVGADPTTPQSTSGRASPPGLPDPGRQIGALAGFLLLCLGAFAYAILAARRMARESGR